ncbi:uncharacterized protein LOC144742627 [Ciona intestinalis]
MQRRSDHSYIELSPAEIRFLQDSIGPYFRSGGSVNECIYDILRGRSDINTFPKIRIVKRDNLFWSLDNRRLYIFRVLEERGHIRTITARLLPEFRFDEDKFTSKNNGVSIYLRGGDKTLSHSKNVGKLKSTAAAHYHYNDYGGEVEYDHDDQYDHTGIDYHDREYDHNGGYDHDDEYDHDDRYDHEEKEYHDREYDYNYEDVYGSYRNYYESDNSTDDNDDSEEESDSGDEVDNGKGPTRGAYRGYSPAGGRKDSLNLYRKLLRCQWSNNPCSTSGSTSIKQAVDVYDSGDVQGFAQPTKFSSQNVLPKQPRSILKMPDASSVYTGSDQINSAINESHDTMTRKSYTSDRVSAASTKQVSNTPITRNPTRNINKHVATYVPRTTGNSPLLPRERNEQECCCVIL